MPPSSLKDGDFATRLRGKVILAPSTFTYQILTYIFNHRIWAESPGDGKGSIFFIELKKIYAPQTGIDVICHLHSLISPLGDYKLLNHYGPLDFFR